MSSTMKYESFKDEQELGERSFCPLTASASKALDLLLDILREALVLELGLQGSAF